MFEGSSTANEIYGEKYKNFYSKSNNCGETLKSLYVIIDCYVNLYDYITLDDNYYWNTEKEKNKRYPKYFLKLLKNEIRYIGMEIEHYEALLKEDV